MAKSILFNPEAQTRILKGLAVAADAVGGTLGPKGRNVFIKKEYENIVTNDGATIATSIELADPFEDMGAQIVRNTSSQTNDDAGDGTTTTAVLLKAIIDECINRPENVMEIRDSILKASQAAIEILKSQSISAKENDLSSVALISAENDEIASMIIDVTSRLGNGAVINVEDSKTFTSSSEVVKGYDVPVGFVSPFFITEKETGKAILEDTYVLVSEKKIATFTDIQRISKEFQDKGISQCVIVCDDIDDSMVGLFARHNLQGVFKSVIIRARGEMLEDIEGAVGATSVADKNGVTFQNINLSHLGKVEKVIVDAHKSLFLGSNASGMLRAAELDGIAESEENTYRKARLKERAAKLRGGIGVLRIGASSDYERTYLKLKAEDAIKAVQAAEEEGIVQGGGMALWRVSQQLSGDTPGEQILKNALKSPLKKIIENAGEDYIEITKQLTEPTMGYDAKRSSIVDMLLSGICDPTKVERCALQNAVSAAASFITTFCAITDLIEKK